MSDKTQLLITLAPILAVSFAVAGSCGVAAAGTFARKATTQAKKASASWAKHDMSMHWGLVGASFRWSGVVAIGGSVLSLLIETHREIHVSSENYQFGQLMADDDETFLTSSPV